MYFSRLGVKGLNVSRTKNLAPRDFWRQKALGTMLRTLTSAIPQTGSARWFSTWFCRPAHSWSAVSFSLDSSRPERVCWLALCCVAGCVVSLHPSPQVSPFWRLASPWWNSSSCDWEIPCEINSRVSAFVAGVLGENVWGWVSTWWRWGWVRRGSISLPHPHHHNRDVCVSRKTAWCETHKVSSVLWTGGGWARSLSISFPVPFPVMGRGTWDWGWHAMWQHSHSPPGPASRSFVFTFCSRRFVVFFGRVVSFSGSRYGTIRAGKQAETNG